MSFQNQIFYDLVAEELRLKQLVDGIWVRAISDSAGDETLARAVYIKYRVAQLAAEHKLAARRADFLKKNHHEEINEAQERERDRIAVIDSVNSRISRHKKYSWFYDPKRRGELIFYVFFMSIFIIVALIHTLGAKLGH
jgi:hypothetical protein